MYPDVGPSALVAAPAYTGCCTVSDQPDHRPARRMTPVPRRVGYARTKPDQDDLHKAVVELRQLGVEAALVFTDRGSSARGKDRAELQLAIATAQPGDVLVVASLARLGRSHHDLAAIIDVLQDRLVTLEVAGQALEQITRGRNGGLCRHSCRLT